MGPGRGGNTSGWGPGPGDVKQALRTCQGEDRTGRGEVIDDEEEEDHSENWWEISSSTTSSKD